MWGLSCPLQPLINSAHVNDDCLVSYCTYIAPVSQLCLQQAVYILFLMYVLVIY